MAKLDNVPPNNTRRRKSVSFNLPQLWEEPGRNPASDDAEVNAANSQQQPEGQSRPGQRSKGIYKKPSVEDEAADTGAGPSNSAPGQLPEEDEDEEDIGVDPSKLANLQQKQWRAREAIRNLKTIPPQTRPVWVPEKQRILSENIDSLFNASRDPEPRRSNEDEEDGGYDGEDEYSGNGGLTGNTSQNQAQGGQSLSPRSQKRQRQENTAVNAHESTIENLRPRKKSKIRSGATQHILKDLKTLQPQPLQYMFEGHPREDRSDEWFIKSFDGLYQRIFNFSHDYFGLHDLDQGEFFQPWAVGMTPEFIRHVEEVAVADPADGGWDALLRSTIQRRQLITAIIARILEIHVFGADLWGADAQEKELLLGLERALLDSDGTNPLSFMTVVFKC